MKRGITITIVSAFCVLGAVLFRSLHRKYCFTTPTQAYTTLKQAIKEGVIARGWLPDCLPRSATQIREKRNYERNTVIARFSFDPSEDIAPLLRRGEEIAPSNLLLVRPRPIGKHEPWFPTAITDGRFEELTPSGFSLCAIRDKGRVGPIEVTNTWYIAINQKAGIGYLWFVVEPASP